MGGMTIPVGYGQVTHLFSGVGMPNGAAVVYGVEDINLTETPTAAATILHDAFGDTLLTSMPLEVNLVTTIYKRGPDEDGPSGSFTFTRAGGDTDNAGTPGIAYLIHKQTALGGRRGRGRMYLPGIGEGDVTQAGLVTSTKQENLNTQAGLFLVRLSTDDFPMVLLHNPSTHWEIVNGQPRRIPDAGAIPAPTPVTALVASGVVASQRRRQRR